MCLRALVGLVTASFRSGEEALPILASTGSCVPDLYLAWCCAPTHSGSVPSPAVVSWGRVFAGDPNPPLQPLPEFQTTTAILLCYQDCEKEQNATNTGKKHISHILICLQHASRWTSTEWVVAVAILMYRMRRNLLGKQLAAAWIAPSTWRISRLIEAVCQSLARAACFTWLALLQVSVIF